MNSTEEVVVGRKLSKLLLHIRLKIRDTFFVLLLFSPLLFGEFFLFFFCFVFFFSFFLGSFGNQDRRRVRLSSEEKQKMAASCGQVQPPSSTLLISVRRKRRRPRPRIVLHLRWNVQEWHSRLFKQPCFFLSAFPWDSFGLHVSCLRVSLLSLISLVQVHQINPRLSILEN